MSFSLSDVKRIHWEIISGCDHNCIFCYNPWREQNYPFPSNDLSVKEIKKIVDDVSKKVRLNSVTISGGEPFIHPNIVEIISMFLIFDCKIEITTNGSIINKSVLNSLLKNDILCTISFHSCNKKLFERISQTKDSFDKVVQNIKTLLANDISILINITLNKINLETLQQTLFFLHNIGIKRINLTRVTPRSKKKIFLELDTNDIAKLLNILESFEKETGIFVRLNSAVPYCISESDKIIDKDLFKKYTTSRCISLIKSFSISPSGFVKPCADSTVNLGDLKKEKIEDVIERISQNYNDIVRTPLKCLNCTNFPSICSGGCRIFYRLHENKDPLMWTGKSKELESDF